MSNPVVQAFFVGRAVAELLTEQAAQTVTDVLSEVGKFDAEQRERLRQFSEQVIERAAQAEAMQMGDRGVASVTSTPSEGDLQAMIDDLRAEIAQLRSELKRHRETPV